MLRRSPDVHSDRLKGLIHEVQRTLHKAVDNPSQRVEILHQLFADLVLEVDTRAQALLYGLGNSKSSTCSDNSRPCLCFYEVIAQQYVQIPDVGRAALPLFVKLWSQSFASQIFALLFYRWLFECPIEQQDGFLRYATAFVEGSTSIFWIDIQSNARRFYSLYHYIVEEVAMKPSSSEKLPIQAQRDLALLVSRFFFFYERGEELKDFLNECSIFSNCFMGGSADVFVIELTDQLQKIKVEPVLTHYLQSGKALKGLELRVTTSTRLKSALYSFTSPGGPMYPTRLVRHAAWETLDFLFPVGRSSRHLISLFFRLLHPYYWPSSFWNFMIAVVAAIFNRVYGIMHPAWRFLRGLQPPHNRQN